MNDSNVLLSGSPSRREPWNKGKLPGAKPPLRPGHVWSIRTKLQLDGRTRDLALFNVAIDSKLRGCDVVAIRVDDVAPNGYALDRATVRQRKTGDIPTELSPRGENPRRWRGEFTFGKLFELVGNFVNASLNASLVFFAAWRTGCARSADGLVADFYRQGALVSNDIAQMDKSQRWLILDALDHVAGWGPKGPRRIGFAKAVLHRMRTGVIAAKLDENLSVATDHRN